MKKHLLLTVFILLGLQLQAQNLSDITFSQNVYNPTAATVDRNGNIHMGFSNKTGIYYQTFNASGVSLTNPRVVTSYAKPGYEILTSVAEKNGSVKLIWASAMTAFNKYITGAALDLSTDSLKSGIMVNASYSDAARFDPQIYALNDTLFVAVWTGGGRQTVDKKGVYGRILSPDLVPIGDEIWISDVKDASCSVARIAVKPDGSGFRAFWRDNRTGAAKVYGREFSSDGTPKAGSFLVSEDIRLKDFWYLDAVSDINGNFTVAWSGDLDGAGYQIQLRRFDKDGNPIGATEIITSRSGGVGTATSVSIDIDSLGNSVLAWEQKNDTDNSLKIFAMRYSPENKPIGTPFRVSAKEDGFTQMYPVVKIRGGKIYCFWTEQKDTLLPVQKGSILDFSNPVLNTSSVDGKKTVTDFSLSQNYPNPFNPATTISYSVPRQSMVELKVFDMLGREIRTLISKEQDAGEHYVQFDGSDLTSGMYIYRLRAGEYTLTRKMMLVK